jgi:hypothetical protein
LSIFNKGKTGNLKCHCHCHPSPPIFNGPISEVDVASRPHGPLCQEKADGPWPKPCVHAKVGLCARHSQPPIRCRHSAFRALPECDPSHVHHFLTDPRGPNFCTRQTRARRQRQRDGATSNTPLAIHTERPAWFGFVFVSSASLPLQETAQTDSAMGARSGSLSGELGPTRSFGAYQSLSGALGLPPVGLFQFTATLWSAR